MARSLEEETGRVSRRRLLEGAIAAGAGLAFPSLSARADPATPLAIPVRPFGRTGAKVTSFGLGCFPVGGLPSDADGVAVVRRALERGCTYFDTAPSYGSRGASERRVGLALEGRRDGVFLATKTLERTATGVRRDLEASLQRLRTDRVDLLQVHCVQTIADLDVVLGEDGPVAAILEAKERGQVRFLGVSVHTDPAVARAAVERGPFDAILLPLNPSDPHRLSFLEDALPAAAKKGVARVGMKAFASGNLLRGDAKLAAEDCLRYAFALDVSTTIVGCGTAEQVDLAARVAADAKPLSEERRKELVKSAQAFASRRDVEWYKRS